MVNIDIIQDFVANRLLQAIKVNLKFLRGINDHLNMTISNYFTNECTIHICFENIHLLLLSFSAIKMLWNIFSLHSFLCTSIFSPFFHCWHSYYLFCCENIKCLLIQCFEVFHISIPQTKFILFKFLSLIQQIMELCFKFIVIIWHSICMRNIRIYNLQSIVFTLILLHFFPFSAFFLLLISFQLNY